MKKITKTLAIVLALAMAVFALVACGGGGGGATQAPAGDAEAVTEAAAAAGDASEAATEAAAPAGDAEFVFKVTSHDQEAGGSGVFIHKWCDAVTEASGGRIQFNLFFGGALAPATESYNVLTSGAADIAWGLPSFYQGKFPLTEATGLPFTATDVAQGTYAMWDLYQNSEAIQKEWSEVKMILLHSNCDCSLLVKDPKPEKPEDLAGRQCRFVGGTSTDLANDLGIVATNVNVSDIYESLEKGVIDSAANCGWDLISGFKLYEPVDAIWNIKMNINPCFYAMNLDSYNKLPDDLKAIIDEYSGMVAGDMLIESFAALQEKVMTEHADMIYEADEDTMAQFREYGKGVADRWVEAKGDEGKAVYDMWIEYLDKYKDKIIFP